MIFLEVLKHVNNIQTNNLLDLIVFYKNDLIFYKRSKEVVLLVSEYLFDVVCPNFLDISSKSDLKALLKRFSSGLDVSQMFKEYKKGGASSFSKHFETQSDSSYRELSSFEKGVFFQEGKNKARPFFIPYELFKKNYKPDTSK